MMNGETGPFHLTRARGRILYYTLEPALTHEAVPPREHRLHSRGHFMSWPYFLHRTVPYVALPRNLGTVLNSRTLESSLEKRSIA